MAVSPLLFEALEVACVVAVQTAGTVDPTVGSALVDLGYDRDFDQIGSGTLTPVPARPAPGWWQIELDPGARTVAVRPASTSTSEPRPRLWPPTGRPGGSPES